MTDPFTAAVVAAQAAQQAAAVLQQENTTLTGQHAVDQATITAQAAQIAELQAELHPTPPPPPKPPATLFGVNASTTGEKAANSAGLSPQVWRAYIGLGKPLRLPFPLGPGESFAVTFKAMPADVLAGKLDGQITALCKSAPTDRPLYLDYWHEPEDDIENGTFTAADFRAASARVAQVAHAAGPHVRVALCLMNYTLLKMSGRNWLDYYPGDSIDLVAFDCYQFTGTYESPTGPGHLFDGAAAAAASVGKPWAIAETGIDRTAYSGQARTDALTALARSAAQASPPPEFVAYFVQDPRWALTAADAAAWEAGQ